MKGLPLRAALQSLRIVGLVCLTLLLFATTKQDESLTGSGMSIETPGLTSHRGKVPPVAHEHHQLDASSAAMSAFEQAADEQPDEDPVLDVALDVSGWRGVTTRTLECAPVYETRSKTTQVVLRARPARGPPVA